ncbi:hypothetical protein BT69DRAFT_1268668 [Atractiella rhizophila]|nr:hypothetical protein BT69DRAFT_1268668 [Atractiella rhizophila]
MSTEQKTKEVEMKDVSSSKEEQPATPAPPALITEIKASLALLEQASSLLEPRFTTRVLRTLPGLRRRLGKDGGGKELKDVVEQTYAKHEGQRKQELLSLLDVDAEMDVEDSSKASKTAGNTEDIRLSPDGDIFISLLVVIYLLDREEIRKAHSLTLLLLTQLQSLSLRSLDQLQARVYFYYVRCVELITNKAKEDGDTSMQKALEDVRPVLLKGLRTATLRGDEDSQATLTNLLLRNYLLFSLYDQADLLISKSSFPIDRARNPQLARYLYYTGRIRAVQLNYSEAHSNLQQSIRRAPPPANAPGFLQTVYKLFIVVELLMGDIPERSIFRQPVLKKALLPYFDIVPPVRIGDVDLFNSTVETHSARFSADSNLTLILRLRHTVIKTALRTISLSYSRIPLAEVSQKLKLDSEEDAEYVVAKAIRDGVVDVEIDHEKGWMVRRQGGKDIYSTYEPARAFDERIKFCLKLHNDSVKAMRYPLNAHKKELESVEEAQERARELQAEIAENDDPDEDFGGDLF